MMVFIVCFLLLFAGVILISASTVKVKVSPPETPSRHDVEVIWNGTLLWDPFGSRLLNFTAFINKGDKIYLEITPPVEWGEFSDGDPNPGDPWEQISGHVGPFFVYVDFNYTDETGYTHTTQFEVVYYYRLNPAKVVLAPVYPIHVYMNRSETLLVENPENATIISGTALFSGKYTIWIAGPFPIRYSIPPEELQQFKNQMVNVWVTLSKWKKVDEIQPYIALLPVGCALLVAGVSTFILSNRRKKHRVRISRVKS